MILWLIKWIWGDTCSHKWELIKRNETSYYTNMLFHCTSCGRFKKKTI